MSILTETGNENIKRVLGKRVRSCSRKDRPTQLKHTRNQTKVGNTKVDYLAKQDLGLFSEIAATFTLVIIPMGSEQPKKMMKRKGKEKKRGRRFSGK